MSCWPFFLTRQPTPPSSVSGISIDLTGINLCHGSFPATKRDRAYEHKNRIGSNAFAKRQIYWALGVKQAHQEQQPGAGSPLPEQLMPPTLAAAHSAAVSVEHPERSCRPEDLFLFVSQLLVAVSLCLCSLLGEGPQDHPEKSFCEWAASQVVLGNRFCIQYQHILRRKTEIISETDSQLYQVDFSVSLLPENSSASCFFFVFFCVWDLHRYLHWTDWTRFFFYFGRIKSWVDKMQEDLITLARTASGVEQLAAVSWKMCFTVHTIHFTL